MSLQIGKIATPTYKLTWTVDHAATPVLPTIALVVTKPDGSTASPSSPAPGPVVIVAGDDVDTVTVTWTADVEVDQDGRWVEKWNASNAVIDQTIKTFMVGGIVDLDEARAHLNFDDDDTDDDAELQFFVDAANEWMATAVTTTEPLPVVLGTLELIRHWWDTQRGPAGSLSGDGEGGRGFIGFAIPNRVRELIEPWSTGNIRGGTPLGSFPDAACWPDPSERPFNVYSL